MGSMCRIKMLKGVTLATKDSEGLGLVSGSTSPHITRCELSATADYLYFWPIQVFDYLKSPKGSLGKTAEGEQSGEKERRCCTMEVSC